MKGKACGFERDNAHESLQLTSKQTNLVFTIAEGSGVETSDAHEAAELKEVPMIIETNAIVQP
jgi:hypothetical protein